MSRMLKTSLGILTAIVLLCSTIAYAADTTTVTNGGASSQCVRLIDVIGTLSLTATNKTVTYVLTTDKLVAYDLTGNTLGIGSDIGKKLLVNGYILNPITMNPQPMSSALTPVKLNQTLYIIKYSLFISPTPPPITFKVTGKLTSPDNGTTFNLTVSNNTTVKSIEYLLTGNTDGMKAYLNPTNPITIVVEGYIQASATNGAIIVSPPISPPIYPTIYVVDFYSFVPTVTSNGVTYTCTVLLNGDVNGDGSINLSDLVAIRNQITGASPLNSIYASAGDLYGEGQVTLNDLVGVMAYISGSGTISQTN